MPKPTRERLTVGQSCIATGPGLRGKKIIGRVVEVQPKGYLVADEQGFTSHFSETKVSPLTQRKPTPKLVPLVVEDLSASVEVKTFETPRFQDADRLLKPLEKPRPPARSPTYLAWVRQQPCCNCDAPGPSDPHHEGKRGVSQKCSDLLAVPLCRRCHQTYTDKNRLPDPFATISITVPTLRSREDSLAVLHKEQRWLFDRLLSRLPPEEWIRTVMNGIASLSEERLQDLLKVRA